MNRAPAATRRAGELARENSMAASGSGAPGRVLMIPLFSPTSRVKADGETALTTMFAGRPRTAKAFVSPTTAAFAVAYACLGLGPGPVPSPYRPADEVVSTMRP